VTYDTQGVPATGPAIFSFMTMNFTCFLDFTVLPSVMVGIEFRVPRIHSV